MRSCWHGCSRSRRSGKPAAPNVAAGICPIGCRGKDGALPVTPLVAPAEFDAVCKVLRSGSTAIDIDAQIATTNALSLLFATLVAPFDILHFTGHGTTDAHSTVLVLEGDLGRALR